MAAMTMTTERRAGDDVLTRVDAWWRAANYLSVPRWR
jgi:phosphoketolase